MGTAGFGTCGGIGCDKQVASRANDRNAGEQLVLVVSAQAVIHYLRYAKIDGNLGQE